MIKSNKKSLITYSVIILIVTISLFSFFFFFFFFRSSHNNTPKYVFPNPLHLNATFSDMVVENDSHIHFVTYNHDYSNNRNGPTYTLLDIANNSIDVDYISPHTISTDFQVKICLNQDKNPIIYRYGVNSFFDEVGSVRIKENDSWGIYPALEDWPWYHCSVSRGPIFNFHVDLNNNLSIGYIYLGYLINGDFDSPVIYNETSNSWIFLNNTFTEIKGREVYAPGDFITFNNNIAMTWTRVIDYHHSQPLLAIYWENEGWKLYSIGSSSHQLIPISLIYQEEKLNLFYYDPGSTFYNGSIRCIQFTNSTAFYDTKIADIGGKIRFYSDSICSLSNNNYLFFYSKKILSARSQYDMYLGIFNESHFREIQLSKTEEFDEYYVHCDLSTKFVHYTWTQSPWNENETINPFESVIFYNRTLITEINEHVLNLRYIILNCSFEVDNENQNPLLGVMKKRMCVEKISIKNIFCNTKISYLHSK